VKFTVADKNPFGRLKFKVKREILSFRQAALDVSKTGTYVAAQDWNALIADPEVLVLDTRNAYETVTGYFVEAAAAQKSSGHPVDVIVLDRPNLIGNPQPQGPISDPPAATSYLNYMPLPAWHGLTLGELARYINGEKHLDATVTVVPVENWTRTEYFDETGLPWTNPSPNLRSMTAAVIYPGTSFVETTNLSVGRGMETAFEQIGAPYINAPELATYLTARNIPGVSITPTTFAIAEDTNHYPYHGQTIPGVHFTVTDRSQFQPSLLGLELLSALHHLYPVQFNLAKAGTIVGSATTMQALTENQDPRAILASWSAGLAEFQQRRLPYLLYH